MSHLAYLRSEWRVLITVAAVKQVGVSIKAARICIKCLPVSLGMIVRFHCNKLFRTLLFSFQISKNRKFNFLIHSGNLLPTLNVTFSFTMTEYMTRRQPVLSFACKGTKIPDSHKAEYSISALFHPPPPVSRSLFLLHPLLVQGEYHPFEAEKEWCGPW